MDNEKGTNEKLTVDDLLKSKDFNNIVNVIIYEFGKMQSDIKDDIRQICSIVVVRLIEQYDPDLNDRFWSYAKPFMTEYAKRELNNQKNVVHLPYNRTNGGFKEYEKIKHKYEDLIMPDGHLMPLEYKQNDVNLMIDIKNALEKLNEMQSKVVKMRIGIIQTNNGKTDFASIGDTLGIPMHRARAKFISAQKKLKKYIGNID